MLDDSTLTTEDPEQGKEGDTPAASGALEPTENVPHDYGWRRGDAVLDVNPEGVVDKPHTTGMPSEPTRTTGTLQLNVGTALLTCPHDSPACQANAGVTLAVALLQRPVPWFSWGGSLEAQQYGQTWRIENERWSLERRVVSARLLAQVHIAGLGRVDPYVGIGLGGGAVHEKVRSRASDESATWLGTPLYSARAGMTYRIADGIELGALVDWANLRVNTGESCPWAIGGICSSNNWTAFSPQNALWNAAATVSFAFGQRL